MADIALQLQLPDYSRVAQGVTGLVGLQGNILQQKALRQQIASNQATSQALQGAINPQTGDIDMAAFANALKGSPYAYNIPEMATKVQGLANAQLTNQNIKLEVAKKQLDYFDSQLGGLVQKGENVSPQDVVQVLSRGVSQGMIPVNTAAQYASEIPSDPGKLQEWVRQHWTSLQGAKEQLGLMPQGQTVNAGGQQLLLNRDPVTGKITTSAIVQNTLTPGEASTNVEYIDPTTGAKYAITKAQQLAMMSGQAPGQAPQGQAGGYTGRMNPPAGNVPAGALPVALGPAQQASMTAGATAQAEGSAKAAQELANSTADAPMRINLLQQARDALPSITTGPGTEWRNNAASLINSTPALGAIARAAGLDPNNIKNYDEFKKIMTQYGNSVSAGLGTGTDSRLNAALTGNPNVGISNLANDEILTKTIAAEKMRQAQSYAFQNSGLTPDKFNQWRTQWNKEVNPDAFVFASMSPAQRQSFIQRKTKDGTLQQFKRDLFKAQPYLEGQ